MLNRQQNGGIKLQIDRDLKVKTVSSFSGEVEQTDYFLTSESNPYFCEYKISKSLYDLLHRIAEMPGLIVQSSNNPVLLNLIYRGIIKIEESNSFMEEETHKFENLLNGFVVPKTLNKKTKVEPIESKFQQHFVRRSRQSASSCNRSRVVRWHPAWRTPRRR